LSIVSQGKIFYFRYSGIGIFELTGVSQDEKARVRTMAIVQEIIFISTPFDFRKVFESI
jgi:hypothetical protein